MKHTHGEPSPTDIAWAAGLFEGEGHPYSGDNLIEVPIKRRMASGEIRTYTARRCRTCQQGHVRASLRRRAERTI